MAEKKEKLPGWDLSDLYKGMNDPAIERDLENFKRTIRLLPKNTKAKLAD